MDGERRTNIFFTLTLHQAARRVIPPGGLASLGSVAAAMACDNHGRLHAFTGAGLPAKQAPRLSDKAW